MPGNFSSSPLLKAALTMALIALYSAVLRGGEPNPLRYLPPNSSFATMQMGKISFSLLNYQDFNDDSKVSVYPQPCFVCVCGYVAGRG
ncbi:hypothetical protein CEXT_324741 [Caerostris extrusa]|uniref:Uncharacterized protein n=1 Tax=Caerostris extrusa TaxID=172846 RepID=A0AAV4WGU3_CAEEX|nr:hypothetical protein CEXT_324741 [Caerostris extrusa]